MCTRLTWLDALVKMPYFKAKFVCQWIWISSVTGFCNLMSLQLHSNIGYLLMYRNC